MKVLELFLVPPTSSFLACLLFAELARQATNVAATSLNRLFVALRKL
jgi:hypothetical protein